MGIFNHDNTPAEQEQAERQHAGTEADVRLRMMASDPTYQPWAQDVSDELNDFG